MLNRKKVLGCLIGGAIGDALGMPVETRSAQKIRELYPDGIKKYEDPVGHKYFNSEEMPAGSTTDDTQLTIAVVEGLIKGKQAAIEAQTFDPILDAIAAEHVSEMRFAVGGWGKTTEEAVRRLANGVHWSESGKTTEPNRGSGNGLPMKIGPIGLLPYTTFGRNFTKDKGGEASFNLNQRLVELSAMTHYSQMSAYAAVLHAFAITDLVWEHGKGFVRQQFLDNLKNTIWGWEKLNSTKLSFDVKYLDSSPEGHDIKDRIVRLHEMFSDGRTGDPTNDELREAFGGGSCYVYDSLPFAYGFFARSPHSVQAILECAGAGGDTDTNAKIVGEMIGVLNGIDIFTSSENRWMVEGLKCYDRLVDLADRFCAAFEVE